MAWTMLINGDPDASLLLVDRLHRDLAGAGAVFAYFLYRPLFRQPGTLPVRAGPQLQLEHALPGRP